MAALFTQTEIEQKIEIWASLSDLYLDTDVSLSFANIICTIRKSPFSLVQTEEILRWEVRPAFYGNLLGVAGEWAGWLEDEVLEHIQTARQKPPLFMRRPFRNWMSDCFMPTEEWSEIASLFNSQSETAP